MTKKMRGPDGSYILRGMPAEITKLVDGESDRGALLILGAYLDELLADVIREACISNELGDALLEYGQPAGDFGSRIAIAAALGLIHSSEAAGLQALRKMRNAAAHFDRKGRGFSVLFDSDSTIDQVANLASSVNLKLSSRDPAVVKEQFIVCCRLIALRLMLRVFDVIRPDVPLTLKQKADIARSRQTASGEGLRQLDELIKRGDHAGVQALMAELGSRLQAAAEARQPLNRDADQDIPPVGAT